MKYRKLSLNPVYLEDGKQQFNWGNTITVKILKFGTPQTIPIIVLKIEKFDVTLH